MIPPRPSVSVRTAPIRSTSRAETPSDMTAIAIVSGMNARPVWIAS